MSSRRDSREEEEELFHLHAAATPPLAGSRTMGGRRLRLCKRSEITGTHSGAKVGPFRVIRVEIKTNPSFGCEFEYFRTKNMLISTPVYQ